MPSYRPIGTRIKKSVDKTDVFNLQYTPNIYNHKNRNKAEKLWRIGEKIHQNTRVKTCVLVDFNESLMN